MHRLRITGQKKLLCSEKQATFYSTAMRGKKKGRRKSAEEITYNESNRNRWDLVTLGFQLDIKQKLIQQSHQPWR